MPRIIDCHVHHLDDTQVPWVRELGYDRVCLMDPRPEVLAEAVRKHPDFVIPLGWLPMHKEAPAALEALERFRDVGCLGIKICGARARYDDESFYPVYEKIEQYGLPIFFHTGWLDQRIMQQTYPTGLRTYADWYHPITLDRITLDFPSIKLVAFHLGGEWIDHAVLLMHQYPNIYADSCRGVETHRVLWDRLGGDAGGMRTLAKMVYGTDGMASRHTVAGRIRHWEEFLDAVKAPKGVRELFWHRNALHILALDDEFKKTVRLAEAPVTITDFVTLQLDRFGEPAQSKTACTITREKAGLRLDFTCEDPAAVDLVLSAEGPVGELWQNDAVEVFISPANDEHYFHFVVNALGRASVEKDRGSVRELAEAAEGDITNEGWTVSLTIPFDLVGAAPAADAVWGLQLCRNKRTQPSESISWMQVPGTYRDTSSFGRLVFE